MQAPSHQLNRVVWTGVALTSALLVLAFLLAMFRARLAEPKPLPVYGRVADFTLTNQDAQAVSLGQLRGKVWIADIIFTRCAGPCLGMTRQMQALQKALPVDSPVKLVSLTTDPEFDTPPVLNKYAQRFGADPHRWLFLTGSKKQIADVAVGSLKLSAVEQPADQRESPDDLFVHSTIFVIVDKQARLRGVFETTGEGVDPGQTQARLLSAARQLEREG